jgi:hypothetical protein
MLEAPQTPTRRMARRRVLGIGVRHWPVLAALFALLWCLTAIPALAEPPSAAYQIVVHPTNPQASITRDTATQTFLRKVSSWSHGGVIRPVDLPPASPTREKFSQEVLARSVAAVRSYWLQIIFAGRGVPPPELKSDDEVISYVLREPGSIGYVSGRANLRGARVLVVQ